MQNTVAQQQATIQARNERMPQQNAEHARLAAEADAARLQVIRDKAALDGEMQRARDEVDEQV